VNEYVIQFSELVDQLMAYESDANPLYYVMRFVDGLKPEIKSMVMIQHPATLDVVCALALVQEEASDSGRRREFCYFDSSSGRSTPKPAFPLSLPPMLDNSSPRLAEDKRCADYTKPQSADDKFKALR
jgi:hypothetical protein